MRTRQQTDGREVAHVTQPRWFQIDEPCSGVVQLGVAEPVAAKGACGRYHDARLTYLDKRQPARFRYHDTQVRRGLGAVDEAQRTVDGACTPARCSGAGIFVEPTEGQRNAGFAAMDPIEASSSLRSPTQT
jgi:hypothetical protein